MRERSKTKTIQERQLKILKSGRWIKGTGKWVKKDQMKKLIDQGLVKTTDLDGVTLYKFNLGVLRKYKSL